MLHSLLEIDNRDIGFIGISNWRLDASKMNRAIYLARPDPLTDELMFTSISIYQSMSKLTDEPRLIRVLAETYDQLKMLYKETPFADYYGLRDFYCMIKQVSRDLISTTDRHFNSELVIVKRAI